MYKKILYYFLIIVALVVSICLGSLKAQQKGGLSFWAESSANTLTGEYIPMWWLTVNQYGLGDVNSHNVYVRVGVAYERTFRNY